MNITNNAYTEYQLSDLIDIVTDKIKVFDLNLEQYISTENMLVNCSDIEKANSLPQTDKVNRFLIGDTLFSNIRTYFKKSLESRIFRWRITRCINFSYKK